MNAVLNKQWFKNLAGKNRTQTLEMPSPMFDRLESANAIQKYGTSSHSKHGGLWTDLDNADEILQQKLNSKTITDAEAEHLDYFIKNGYVILNKLIPNNVIDTFLSEQEKIKHGEITGHFVEFIDNGQHFHGKPYTPELIGKRFKLIDVYAKSEAARNLNLDSGIVRFLNLLFEMPPLAFQSLSFYTGSGQSIHQDTTYVRVNSPMELVATWIALEDIKPNTGELEFYPGSHKFPDFQFSGNPGKNTWFKPGESKWFDRQNFEEHARYIKWLNAQAELHGLEKKKFHAKKGDVLFWTNDFAHGGSQNDKPDQSRLSLVTHYCPTNRNPYYFHTRAHAPKIKFNNAFYTHVDHPSKPLPIDFDSQRYLELNYDIKNAGVDPINHYMYFGSAEKRKYK